MWPHHVRLITDSAESDQCTVSATRQLVTATPQRLPDSAPRDDDLDPCVYHKKPADGVRSCSIIRA